MEFLSSNSYVVLGPSPGGTLPCTSASSQNSSHTYTYEIVQYGAELLDIVGSSTVKWV
jgi:hypothetical protein